MRTKGQTNGHNVQIAEKVQSGPRPRAGVDELTGVWNRAGFVAAATPMFRSCQRRKAPVALAYFDFYVDDVTIAVPGDPTVDRVLATMGELMRRAFRASDIVGRLDSLRFAVLLPDCTDDALAAVDGVRMLNDDPSSQLQLAAAMVRNVTGGTLDDLMFAADARAKQVKREQLGR